MRMPRIVTALFVAALAIAVSTARDAGAQQKAEGLSDVLSDLLRGAVGDNNDRRVPFGQEQIQLSFAPLVRHVAPAVVNVYATQKVRQSRSPLAGDPFFEQFFGRQLRQRQQNSLGSGVLVDPSGVVVTNFHVIDGADEVRVAMSDGREFQSAIVLKDETLDLAILKIEAKDPFPSVDIGDSDALEVGDLVLAIGNPFGVGQTTTSGIVSALARTHVGVSDSSFFIQTDAAINPGNSGGALVNMSGQLVGINTAIYSNSGGSIGIGFAIPSNIVRAVADAARNGREFFERPYIGANFEPVTPQIAESLAMERPTGALVSSVVDEGPAAKAGIKAGDVLLTFNDAEISSVEVLGYRIATQPVGAKVKLALLRQGTKSAVEVELVRAPEAANATEVSIRGRSPFAGAKVAELSPRLAQRLGVRTDSTGVVVIEIAPDSPAAGFGLKSKDIVREINGETIDTPDKLRQVAEADARWWRFTIERDGQLLRQMLRY